MPLPLTPAFGRSPSATSASVSRRQLEPQPDFLATGIPGTPGPATAPSTPFSSSRRHIEQRNRNNGDIITWNSPSTEAAPRTPRGKSYSSFGSPDRTPSAYNVGTPRTPGSQSSRRQPNTADEGAAGTSSRRLNSAVQGFESARRLSRSSSLDTREAQGLAADGLLITKNWKSVRPPVRMGSACVPPYATSARQELANSAAAPPSAGYRVLHMKETPSPQTAGGFYHPLLHRRVPTD